MDAIINLGYVDVIFRPQAIKKNSDTRRVPNYGMGFNSIPTKYVHCTMRSTEP